MSYFVTTNERGKNQYERLDEVQSHSIIRPIFSLLIIGFCVLFLTLSTWNFKNTINLTSNVHVFYLNRRYSPLCTVSNKFLSFGLDTSLLRDIKNFPIENEKFINLAKQLAPAYVRVGGTSSDCLYFAFNQTAQTVPKKIISPVNDQDISNFTITDIDFENLYKFAIKSKLRMIFDLNVLIRNGDNSWNDTNSKSIISFAHNKGMKLDWQLGNEPNSFHHVFNRTVNATQLANDYYQLRQILNELGYNESILVGPEVNHIGDTNRKGEHYAQAFLENDEDSVNYVTWHQYYLNGKTARVIDFINVSTFDYLPMQIKSMQDVIEFSGKNVSMWLSETSTAYGGGAPELSDRFVAGFLWLDKLGYSASKGVNVVIRQSLFGGNYSMIGPDLMPNPDWWVSIIYKQFVSDKVLKLVSPNISKRVRLYAHCTPEKVLINRVSAITVYGVNIDKAPAHIIIRGISSLLYKSAKIFLYTLTSDDLQSRAIKMNENILKLQPNGDLPPFLPIILEPTQVITLPPYSMVFIVIHGVDVPACRL
ncbi:heparanase [Calliopsis andreniformis]|uniref:heparanase n=1 Tax=Calliopsis andreniformis TaxID=337506 RepID=UPI003FCE215A